MELTEWGEERVEPSPGENLCISLDRNIQSYATQLAYQAMKTKEADSVSIVVMNPKNGEIMAMVNVPEFDLNDPYNLNVDEEQIVNHFNVLRIDSIIDE